MLHLDDVRLYELSEAGSLLFKGPAWLAREARQQAIPSARVGAALGLPAAWVEAEAGLSDSDPVSLGAYWRQRLAPPSAEARKPLRPRERLPAETLLEPQEAARRLCATPAALRHLEADGSLPALRVEGTVRYDGELVARIADADDGPEAAQAAEERRALVRDWARFEYASPAPMPAPAPAAPRTPPPASAPTPEDAPADAPRAYEIPEDLGFGDIPPASGLLEIEGFETHDEP
jgi:hypothetical protein